MQGPEWKKGVLSEREGIPKMRERAAKSHRAEPTDSGMTGYKYNFGLGGQLICIIPPLLFSREKKKTM